MKLVQVVFNYEKMTGRNQKIPASEDKMHSTIKVMDTGDETFFCITLSALKLNII